MTTILPPSKNLGNNRVPEINQSISVVVVLSTLSLVGRLVSRRLQKTPLAASDYTIILGWLTAWGTTTIVYTGQFILHGRGGYFARLAADANSPLAVTLGLGKHIEMVPLENITMILKVCRHMTIKTTCVLTCF